MTTEERQGDWFVTFTGKQFFPLDPRIEDIDIKDIAHSLSLQTRWMGHSQTHYSIANHSIACARIAEQQFKVIARSESTKDFWRWALMHDASEAYVGDVIRPLKRRLGYAMDGGTDLLNTAFFPFKMVEERIQQLIAEKFSLCWPIPDCVHEIDNRMLITEAQAITNYAGNEHWTKHKQWSHIRSYGEGALRYLEPAEAERTFLALATEYFGL